MKPFQGILVIQVDQDVFRTPVKFPNGITLNEEITEFIEIDHLDT